MISTVKALYILEAKKYPATEMMITWVHDYAEADDIVDFGTYPRYSYSEDVPNYNIAALKVTGIDIMEHLHLMYKRHVWYSKGLKRLQRTCLTPKRDDNDDEGKNCDLSPDVILYKSGTDWDCHYGWTASDAGAIERADELMVVMQHFDHHRDCSSSILQLVGR